ncbi:uncharacterized protein EDB91DRAFT_1163949 [Suillus paluster]|uniref:uncharacterized protein n=1 Tax=Suillus paluster TaxID=48578 RepID=UPI001B86E69F|nr:uncharacterized protein EDB91DRAFT_1163949 [Suillus paluster]KAG1727470.1 hypothetical protein EDB91DRAFT_1163949 [Suillus paluster]
MPAANRVHIPVDCPVCHKTVSRKADLSRHMRIHDGNKEALMHACPFPDCDYKTLQKSNVQTHIRTHTRERSKICPHPGCAFATTDPGSLTRHRKQLHGYEPKARRNHGGRAARQSAAAPYSPPRPMKADLGDSCIVGSGADLRCRLPVPARPDANFSYPPGNNLNYSQPDVFEDFLQNNGSGYFDGCMYQYNTTYPMTQPSVSSGHHVY